VYTDAGRERGAGAGEPAELGAPVREAARVAGAAAALPQGAQLRLVRPQIVRDYSSVPAMMCFKLHTYICFAENQL